jgi:hypothetical protein
MDVRKRDMLAELRDIGRTESVLPENIRPFLNGSD